MSGPWTSPRVWDGFPRYATGILNASFPSTEAAWSPILPCLGFFASIFFVSIIISGPILRVNRKYLPILGACSMSFVHGWICLLIGYPVLKSWTDFRLDEPNTRIQSMMMQISFAYLTADTVQMICFDRDVLFLAHHLLSLMYLYAVLYLDSGAISAVFVFFLGELTSPILNIFTVLKSLRHEYPWADKLFVFVSPIFSVSFVTVRSMIAPPLVIWYSRSMLMHSPRIPWPWRLFMVTLVGLGMIGSQLWSLKCVTGLAKSIKKRGRMSTKSKET